MALKARRTNDDYLHQGSKPVETAILLFICTALGWAIYTLMVIPVETTGETLFPRAFAALIGCAIASFMYSMSYVSTISSTEYYLASIPMTGIGRVIFFIWTWVFWPVWLVSYLRMKHGDKVKAKMDVDEQANLSVIGEHYRSASRETRFAPEICEQLAAFCRLQLLSTNNEMSETESLLKVEGVIQNQHVLQIMRQHGKFCIAMRACAVQDNVGYNLGIFMLMLNTDGTFELERISSGRLTNEMLKRSSLDYDLLDYVEEIRMQIQRQIFAGNIDKAVLMVTERLNDGHCLAERQPYHLCEHYHKAEF